MAKLLNEVLVKGQHDSQEITLKTAASVELSELNIDIKKEADLTTWIAGYLTYTITITNNEAEAITDGTISDTIDPAIAKLVEESLTIDDVAVETTNYTYNSTSGELDVGNTAAFTTAASGTTVIKYKVEKV